MLLGNAQSRHSARATEMWSGAAETKTPKDAVIDASWPELDESALTKSSQTIVAQVNGKVRAKLEIPADADKAATEAAALDDANVKRFLEGVTVRKVIVVPGKLVNIVAN